ncbi:calpain-3-like [Salmo trutta]|uniref:calpain-3-like n=1 Tax=Salmo trutta TaxID=8032 RepID=UPI0011309012|nr:calpain-3-like [Salmo trutta]
MHNDYKEKNKDASCGYEIYRKAVKGRNISFVKLGEEECELCLVQGHHLNMEHRENEAKPAKTTAMRFSSSRRSLGSGLFPREPALYPPAGPHQSHERRKRILLVRGFPLNDQLFQLIIRRYSDEQGNMDFDNFIGCLVRLDAMCRAFKTLDKDNNGRIKVNIQEWLQLTMHS